jgi:hypothetical protein
MESAALAQLGERQTEDLKVPSSILGGGTRSFCMLRLLHVSVDLQVLKCIACPHGLMDKAHPS